MDPGEGKDSPLNQKRGKNKKNRGHKPQQGTSATSPEYVGRTTKQGGHVTWTIKRLESHLGVGGKGGGVNLGPDTYAHRVKRKCSERRYEKTQKHQRGQPDRKGRTPNSSCHETSGKNTTGKGIKVDQTNSLCGAGENLILKQAQLEPV